MSKIKKIDQYFDIAVNALFYWITSYQSMYYSLMFTD